MATTHSLNAETRVCTGTGKLNQLRVDGFIPAVMYGGKENRNLQLNVKEFTTLLTSSVSEHILIDLTIDGAEKSTKVLLKDVQHDRLHGIILHVDFLEVDDNTVITAPVALVVEGEPVGVKQGGLLDQLVHELDVKCMSKDLPEDIKIDVTSLSVGQTLTVKEINFPEGVTPILNGDVIVVIISASAASISSKA